MASLKRAALAVPLALVALYLAYGFGAGYFVHIYLPTPLNLIATLWLITGTLAAAGLFVFRGHRRST